MTCTGRPFTPLLPPARRLDLHHRVATALLRRHERGGQVFSAELAYHFTAAIPAADEAPAVDWAYAAARADSARFAFIEAAGHLARVRSALADTGQRLPDATWSTCSPSKRTCDCARVTPPRRGRCSTPRGPGRPRRARPGFLARWHRA